MEFEEYSKKQGLMNYMDWRYCTEDMFREIANFLKAIPQRKFLTFKLHDLSHDKRVEKPVEALFRMIMQRDKYLIKGKRKEMDNYLFSELGVLWKSCLLKKDEKSGGQDEPYQGEGDENQDKPKPILEDDQFDEDVKYCFQNFFCICNDEEHARISSFLKPIPQIRYMDIVKQKERFEEESWTWSNHRTASEATDEIKDVIRVNALENDERLI